MHSFPETIALRYRPVNSNSHLPADSGLLSTVMVSVSATRRANLKTLVARCESAADFARKADMPETQIRNVLRRATRSDGTRYEMGDKAARKIEIKFGLREGAMDLPGLGGVVDNRPGETPMKEESWQMRAMRIMAEGGVPPGDAARLVGEASQLAQPQSQKKGR